MSQKLIDNPNRDLELIEIAFLGWVNSEWLNMCHGRNCAIPGRTVLSVGHLTGRFNVWLCGMQEKDNFLKVKFFDEVRMLDLLGSCGFEAHEGKSGKRCFWPPRDAVGAILHLCTKGKIGKAGPIPDFRGSPSDL